MLHTRRCAQRRGERVITSRLGAHVAAALATPCERVRASGVPLSSGAWYPSQPQNIFLGANDTVKIGDFGVSRLLNGSADLATTVVTTSPSAAFAPAPSRRSCSKRNTLEPLSPCSARLRHPGSRATVSLVRRASRRAVSMRGLAERPSRPALPAR